MTKAIIAALAPFTTILTAYQQNRLDIAYDDRKNEPSEIELFQGRGGKRLLTLDDAFAARKAIANGTNLEQAIQPLVAIADAFDSNDLDDQARKFWGANDEFSFDGDPKDVALVTSRGGAFLLTLADVLAARDALATIDA